MAGLSEVEAMLLFLVRTYGMAQDEIKKRCSRFESNTRFFLIRFEGGKELL